MGGSTTTTQKSTTAPAPEAMKYYKQLMDRLQSVGNLAYTPYEGERVAGFTPYQQMAMETVPGLQNVGAGTLQEAIEAGRRGTAPVTTADIQRYQDPYQQMVVDAMSAKMRQQEAEDISKLQGASISAGAYGGDRAKLAQAQLMRNQEQERNARIADLMSKGYTQSLGAAQADREAAARGAQNLSALATQQYTQPMSWVRDLYGMGASQQALEQQKLNVPYQTYLEQRAFPYQQTQYLAGLGTGIGSQMGGTSTGSTTQPKPSMWSQIGGLGLAVGLAPFTGGMSLAAAPGMMANMAQGGRVEKENGGGLGETAMFQEGYIPVVNPVKGQGAPGFSAPSPAEQKGGASDMIEQAMSLAQKIKGSNDPTNPASWKTTTTLSPENPASWNTTVSQPSFLSNIGSYLGFAHGGGINVPHYDDGGGVDENSLLLADPRLLAAFKSLGPDRKIKYPEPGPIPKPLTTKEVTEALIDPRLAQAYKAYGVGAKKEPIVPMSITSPPILTTEAVKEQTLPEITAKEQMLPEITVPTQDVMEVGIGQPETKEEGKPLVGISSPISETPKSSSLLGGLLGLSPEAEQAGMAAGLAMMAGQSPFALSNIGQGGLAGVKYYNELMKAKQEQALKEKDLAIKAGQKDIVATDYVTKDGRIVQKDKNTGKLYDGKMNPLSDDEINNLSLKKTLTLSEKSEEKLTNASKILDSLEQFQNTFNPSFGGKIIKGWGDVQNIIGRNLPVDPELRRQAEWWQGYNLFRNQARNTLFGSQLTKTEKEAFDAADISPEQDPEVIKNNLTRQMNAATRALYKLMNSKVQQGYNPEMLEAITEHSLSDLETQRKELGEKVESSFKSPETPKTTGTTVSSSIEQAKKQLQPGQRIEQKSNGYWLIDPPNEPKFLGK